MIPVELVYVNDTRRPGHHAGVAKQEGHRTDAGVGREDEADRDTDARETLRI